MQTYLVVAHRTLVGQHLLDHVRKISDAAGPGGCRFYLVVPVRHPRDHAWTDGEVEATARARLDEGLAAFRNVGVEAPGEGGDATPGCAASAAPPNPPPAPGPHPPPGTGRSATKTGTASSSRPCRQASPTGSVWTSSAASSASSTSRSRTSSHPR